MLKSSRRGVHYSEGEVQERHDGIGEGVIQARDSTAVHLMCERGARKGPQEGGPVGMLGNSVFPNQGRKGAAMACLPLPRRSPDHRGWKRSRTPLGCKVMLLVVKCWVESGCATAGREKGGQG
jgi:hypothetical protein